MKTYLGSAPDSWGVWFPDDSKQIDGLRYLDEVCEAGYRITELGPYGYLPTDPQVLNAELDQRGLKCVASMIVGNLIQPAGVAKLRADLEATCTLLVEVGAKFIGVIEDSYTDLFTGKQIAPSELDAEGWARLIETVESLGKMAREQFGLRLLYHHHADTHVEYEHQAARLLADTRPELVSLVLDTGHLAYRHGDSVAFMKTHHERIPYLHVKSVDKAKRERVKSERIPFAVAVANDLFCEPSAGEVDFVLFRNVLEQIDYEGYMIVEQDMYPAPFDKPLPIARRTFKYLRGLGFGEPD